MTSRLLPRLLVPSCALLIVGCKVYDPLYCDEKEECKDPDRPFCDLQGEHPASEGVARTCIPDPFKENDGGPQTPDAGVCSPQEFLECSDENTAVYCNDQGTSYAIVACESGCNPDQGGCYCEPGTSSCAANQTIHCSDEGQVKEIEPCGLGCNDTGERCIDVDPSNGLAGYLDMSDEAPVVVLANGAIFDTDSGTIEDADGTVIEVPEFKVSAPVDGVAVRVFAVKGLTVGDATVRGTRAMAIVSDGDVLIRGHLRVLAGSAVEDACVAGESTCQSQSPGGFTGACNGAGGGGFGEEGAAGGDATVGGITVAGAAGGVASGNSSLVPLRGGCSGGGVAGAQPHGGAGGGAVQLVSRTLILVEDSTAQASIDGSGHGATGSSRGPGGGSGGGVLLEAPRVVISSGTYVVANGGGAAAGCGNAGEDGQVGVSRADGGTGCRNQEIVRFGAGGDGGSRSLPAGEGQTISQPSKSSLSVAGGGGGGVGRIRINVPSAAEFSEFGAASPPASIGALATR
jgi:hypothetical protein